MPATRLLVVADAKMLAALANGLREGGKFDVLTVALADSATAEAAAERADAILVFYGGSEKPIAAVLQSLSPKVRERGGRVVAVLQRDQAGQRDECFKAGASDLLYMPMPKDQFLARLVASVGLAWAPEAGSPAPVLVATRTATAKIEYAAISAGGVEGPGELPVKTGDTVRLTWASFQAWGLVVRAGPSAQIRFAGLAPDEEAAIREWLKNGGQQPAAPAPAPAASLASDDAITPPGGMAAVAPAPVAAPASAAAAGNSSVPQGGPPPGFADRKPIRPQTATRPPARVTPPVMAPGGNGAAAAAQPAKPAAPVLPGLFDEGAPKPVDPAVAPSGPGWPAAPHAALAKTAAFEILRNKTVPAEAPPALAASAKKIAGMLSSGERAALEKAGPESHFADALAARISLDAATNEGVVLYGAKGMPSVDPAAITALTQLADAAAARLQQEANTAIGKGQVEQLQMVTAASAALSRDVLAFKETSDRLRGLGAAPRLGAGGLDPDMVLPGQGPRPRTIAPSGAPAPVKAELRDFQGLDQGGVRSGKKIAVIIAALGLAASFVYLIMFSGPPRAVLPAEAAGPNVIRIEVSGPSALVMVSPAWDPQRELNKLLDVLQSRDVDRAIVQSPRETIGIIDVKAFKFVGGRKTPPAPK